MTNVANLPEIDGISDNDLFYVKDASDPSNPDKNVPASKMRPPGAKVTNYFRYAGPIVLPAIIAGTEASVTVTVAGITVGDHLIFNMQDALPADLAITSFRVSAADTISVRVRNLHASTGYAGGSLACTALVIRTTA